MSDGVGLFQEPHRATIGDKPVLWFGIITRPSATVAICVSPQGHVGIVPLEEMVADVRFVDDLSRYPALGRTGPGWLELEDMVDEQKPDTTSLTQAVVAGITQPAPAEPSTGPEPLTDREGLKYDPETGLALDS